MTPTTDLSDANAGLVAHCRPIFRNFGARRHFNGPVATVSCLEDNVLYEQALGDVPAGTVVVVDGGGSLGCALMGDRLGGIAVDRGLPGVIINGCVRDTEELAALDIAILSPGAASTAQRQAGPRRTRRARLVRRRVVGARPPRLRRPDGFGLSPHPLTDAGTRPPPRRPDDTAAAGPGVCGAPVTVGQHHAGRITSLRAPGSRGRAPRRGAGPASRRPRTPADTCACAT